MESNTTSIHFDLETNAMDFVPDAQEAKTLRGFINEQDVQLRIMDNEIAQLNCWINALKE